MQDRQIALSSIKENMKTRFAEKQDRPDTGTEISGWNVKCHYNKKEPAGFMECTALFMLEKKQGWDADFRPARKDGGKL